MTDMSLATGSRQDPAQSPTPAPRSAPPLLAMLWRDKLAFVSAVILLLIVICCASSARPCSARLANDQNLRGRNFAPFSLDRGWLFFLGGDSLGRPHAGPDRSWLRTTPC